MICDVIDPGVGKNGDMTKRGKGTSSFIHAVTGYHSKGMEYILWISTRFTDCRVQIVTSVYCFLIGYLLEVEIISGEMCTRS